MYKYLSVSVLLCAAIGFAEAYGISGRFSANMMRVRPRVAALGNRRRWDAAEPETLPSQDIYPLPEQHAPDKMTRRLLLRSMHKSVAAVNALAAAVGMPDTSVAISADEASRSYDKYAPTYDELDGGAAASALGIEEARAKLLRSATGRVLEIGVGTGLNVNKYRFASADGGMSQDGVRSLTLVDISDGMLREAKAKVDLLGIPSHVNVEFAKADATSQLVDLFGHDSFDTVVDTFSLCVMGNQGARDCLQQMRDVVKSKRNGGRILLIENTRSTNPILGAYQDITAEAVAQAGGKGCVYNQDVTALIRRTPGLEIETEDKFAAGVFRSYTCYKQ